MENKEAEKLKIEFINWYESNGFNVEKSYLIYNWWLKKMREREYKKEEKIRLNWFGILMVFGSLLWVVAIIWQIIIWITK